MYYMNNYGVKNERDFVNQLNNKRYGEINILLQLFLEDLYEEQFDYNEKIECYKIEKLYKTDIVISIKSIKKYISIKMGSRNSVHTIGISEFIHFLIENNIPKNIINDYLLYHYGDGTTNGTGINRISVSEFKNKNQKLIDNINEHLNNYELQKTVIEKFVLGKNNSFKGVDAIIHGKPEDFIYIKAKDVKKVLLSFNNFYSTGVHFSKIFCQPTNRCINKNPKYESRRFTVQFKWYSIYDDIIYNMYLQSLEDNYQQC